MKMNKTFENYINEIKNKKVAAVGLGISNRPLVKYLADMGVDITGFDGAPYEKLKDFVDEFMLYKNVNFSLGENYLDNLRNFDIIFKTPAMRPDIKPFLREISKGATLTSEIEAVIKYCEAEIFAVTGSDGKTTTTTLIGLMLEKQGYKVWVGGNIGTPLFDKMDEIEKHHKVVLELGSFQLQTLRDKSPDVAVVTNISPNHLDFHKDMDEYIWSKKNIFRYQSSKGKLIINYDNETTKEFVNEAKGDVRYFSRLSNINEGAIMKDDKIYYISAGKQEYLFDADEIKVKGIHNKENFLAAISAVYGHVDIKNMIYVANTFTGVEHRIEPVREVNGVKFYNDSIGSSPTRTCASLRAFDEKVVLISGGYDKHIPYEIMGEIIIEKVKALILLGQTKPLIKEAYLNEAKKRNIPLIPIIEVDTLQDAVNASYEAAEKGDTVLLSPASASYDMFPNFEIRGRLFKDYVNRL